MADGPDALSRTPIFQVMFILQNSPLPEVTIPDLSVRLVTVDRGAAQFDLTLLISESEGGFDAEFEFNTRPFRARDHRAPGDVLPAAPRYRDGQSGDPVSALPLMTEAEQHRLVVTANDTTAEYPRTQCVHQLVEAQAERTPDAVAVICEDARLSYRELDRWATRLAARLRARGAGPGMPVGVYLERSPALVAGLLAVLKAGAAYLPIDPSLPSERVRFLLRDAGATLVLTERGRHPDDAVESIAVAGFADEAPACRVADNGVTPADLAYLIYTSGSTGQPKGVRIPHQALVNLLWSMRQLLAPGVGDALLAVTSVSFDIAALELYLPLITGGTVVLATREEALDRRRLHAAMLAHVVKIMQATPAMWRMLLQGDWRGHAGLIALSGGEPLTPELADQLLRRVGTPGTCMARLNRRSGRPPARCGRAGGRSPSGNPSPIPNSMSLIPSSSRCRWAPPARSTLAETASPSATTTCPS